MSMSAFSMNRARRSLGKTINIFSKGATHGPVLRTKVQNVTPPPPMKAEFMEEGINGSIFIASWDVRGNTVSEETTLLPRGFDVYVIGIQNCASLTTLSDLVQSQLCEFGDYKEFSYLMSGESKIKTSLALLVFARMSLVDEGAFNLQGVNQIRDRRLSALPFFLSGADLQLSTPNNHMSIKADLNANGGAVTMTCKFYETSFLLINVKLNDIGELNEILARTPPELHPHVFLFGDFGTDVIENKTELDQRLYFENFSRVPAQFQNSRSLVVTRSQSEELEEYLASSVNGHYDLVKDCPPAAFSTFRLHGAMGSAEDVPPPPPPSEDDDSMRVPSVASFRPSMIPPPPPSSVGSRSITSLRTSSAVPPPLPPPDDDDEEESLGSRSRSSTESSTGTSESEKNRKRILQTAIHGLRDTLLEEVNAPFKPVGVCAICDKDIHSSQDCFEANEKKYHRECTKCDDCGALITSQFFLINDRMLCQRSYEKLFIKKCGVCGEVADPLDHLIKTSSNVYHLDCFKCADCEIPLATMMDENQLMSAEFVVDEAGKIFCPTHGSKHICEDCGKKIPSRDAVQVALDGNRAGVFHKSCFKCSVCHTSIFELGGSYVLCENEIYCAKDWQKSGGLTTTENTNTSSPHDDEPPI